MNVVDAMLIAIVGSISVLDISIMMLGLPSISERMRWIGQRLSAAPFSWGILAGHFWGVSRDPLGDSWAISVTALFASVAVVTGAHWLARYTIGTKPWLPLSYVLLGIPAGMYFWPQ